MSDDAPPPDHVLSEGEDEDRSLEDNIKSRSTWLRLFFMAVLVAMYGVAEIVVIAVVVVQFFWVLINGENNKRLQALGQGLATYTYQIVLYLTFNTEERPFPFDMDWPSGAPGS